MARHKLHSCAKTQKILKNCTAPKSVRLVQNTNFASQLHPSHRFIITMLRIQSNNPKAVPAKCPLHLPSCMVLRTLTSCTPASCHRLTYLRVDISSSSNLTTYGSNRQKVVNAATPRMSPCPGPTSARVVRCENSNMTVTNHTRNPQA